MRLAAIGLGIICKSGSGKRYWGEVGLLTYLVKDLSGQRNRLKVQGQWCRIMLVDCCGWVVNQDGVSYQNTLDNGSV